MHRRCGPSSDVNHGISSTPMGRSLLAAYYTNSAPRVGMNASTTLHYVRAVGSAAQEDFLRDFAADRAWLV
jgi:hypothetical protein